MAATDNKRKKIKKLTKKQLRQEILTRLTGVLEDYKSSIGEKKFAQKIKKASKLFAVDLIKALRKAAKTNENKKPASPNN